MTLFYDVVQQMQMMDSTEASSYGFDDVWFCIFGFVLV